MLKRLLLAWDGSHSAQRALDLAVNIARRYGAEIVAVSVAYSPTHAETEEDRVESVEAARKYLEGTFAKVRDRPQRAGVAVEHVVIEGEQPADDLVSYAREHGFDLVVAGHHTGQRSAGRLVLLGLADRLVARSEVPALIVGERGRR
jgi:nucleotide-binding universal stress UspA family protein